MSIRIEDKAFRRKLNKLKITHGKQLRKILRDSTVKMHRYAVHKAPVSSGDLKQGIILEIDSGKIMEGVVTSTKNYSAAVEEGTKPHTIRLRKKQVLAGSKKNAPAGWDNFSKDWAVYGKKVKHPGTAPQPFIHPSWQVGRRYMMDRIKKMLK